MITGILIIAIVSFVAIISYRRPKFEQRLIKNIPLVDWFNILLFPIIFYYGLVLIVRSIIIRSRVEILDFDEAFLLGIGSIFLMYAFVGLSIHFVGKVLSRYINRKKSYKIYQINEVFHGKLSHYISFVCSWMVIFILALLEVNYPLQVPLNKAVVWVIIASGIIGGLSATKAIFYTSSWFGGYNKPLFFLTILLFVVLVSIFRSGHLRLMLYPLNIFIITLFGSIITAFLVRQFLIYSRLSKKRRLKFLSKIVSA